MGRLKSKINIVGGTSLFTLVLLLLTLVSPSTSERSFALCTPDSSTEECMAMPMSTEVGVTTKTVISLALDNQVQMEVVPKSNGATSYASTRLAVSTNSNDGYAIYMQTGSETGNLTGVTTNLSGEISNTAKQNVALDSLETNAYGYALSKTAVSDSTTYSHVPTTSTVVESTTSSAESGGEYAYGDIYYLAFGTKVGTSLPAGQYAGTVTVSAVANPTTLRSMYDLTYMQDMTSDICENTREHYTKQLIDSRDGKSYWVAKLKDGNCWMTQNLALDLSTEKALTPSDTDVAADYTPEHSVNELKVNGNGGFWRKDQDYSWNLGKIVLATPMYTRDDPEIGQCLPHYIEKDNTYVGPYSTDNLAEVCADFGFIDVSGDEWQPTFTARYGNYTFADGKSYAGIVAVDTTAKTYDAHYLLGNYYMWNAATAGFSKELANGEAENSICPKGWKMFSSTNENYYTDRSLAYLFRQYSILEDENGVISFIKTTSAEVASGAKYDAFAPPLYYVANGHVYPWGGTMRSVGAEMAYWSNTTTSVNNARVNTGTSGGYDRFSGATLRCLAK